MVLYGGHCCVPNLQRLQGWPVASWSGGHRWERLWFGSTCDGASGGHSLIQALRAPTLGGHGLGVVSGTGRGQWGRGWGSQGSWRCSGEGRGGPGGPEPSHPSRAREVTPTGAEPQEVTELRCYQLQVTESSTKTILNRKGARGSQHGEEGCGCPCPSRGPLTRRACQPHPGLRLPSRRWAQTRARPSGGRLSCVVAGPARVTDPLLCRRLRAGDGGRCGLRWWGHPRRRASCPGLWLLRAGGALKGKPADPGGGGLGRDAAWPCRVPLRGHFSRVTGAEIACRVMKGPGHQPPRSWVPHVQRGTCTAGLQSGPAQAIRAAPPLCREVRVRTSLGTPCGLRHLRSCHESQTQCPFLQFFLELLC